jgi:protein-S-isoprenylcysteine O-methyltransferase Ste14
MTGLIVGLWLAWGAYWLATSRDVKTTVWHESAASRLMHFVPLTVAVLLMVLPTFPWWGLDGHVLPWSAAAYWVGATLTALGLLFAVWARRRLGRNWSGSVTVKADHELVTGGPYRYVRHPIYSGLLLGFVGSAIARDEWRGWVAVLLGLAAFSMKLRLEERRMRQIFGAAYEAYAARVSALIPGVL